MSLLNGIDLVIELPVIYAISSAENFAYGAISILDKLNIIDYISFGSECGDVNTINGLANVLLNNDILNEKIDTELKKGISYPTARLNVIKSLNVSGAQILESPNNILGVEYTKALKKINSNIIPHTIKRIEVDYNSVSISDNGYASATGIRELLSSGSWENVKKTVPCNVYEILRKEHENNQLIFGLFSYEKEIIYTLRKMSIAMIAELPDVTEGLEFKIKEAVRKN